MPTTEEQLANVRKALNAAVPAGPRRSGRELDLTGALEELSAWVNDDREAGNVFAAHWATLLDDVLWTAMQCGPRLTAALLDADDDLFDEMKACRAILKNTRGAPDRAMRRRIEKAATRLQVKIVRGPVLCAAFEDVRIAQAPDAATTAARLFVAFCGEAGHDPLWFPSRLRSILADDGFAIAAERGESLPADPDAAAGATPEERIALVEKLINEPPVRGEAIVWLRFAHAKLGWPPTLALGDRVTLFDDNWIRSVLQHDPAQLSAYAPDADSDDENFDVKLFVGEEPDEESQGDRDRAVIARVVVPSATAAEAHQVARRTADAIAGLASLYGTRPRLWELDDSFVVRSENGSGGSSFGSPPRVRLDVDDKVALRDDHTGRELANLAETLGPHLPVSDPAIVHAATLLSWLRSARAAAAAPRVLLCARVVEQVAGWAGFGDPRSFSTEILRPAWAVARVRGTVANAAFSGSHELRRRGNPAVAGSFSDNSAPWGGTVHLKQFLESFDDIVTALEGDLSGVERVIALVPRLRSPASSAEWFEAELKNFDRYEARRRRTRNSLVHGGPLALRTVEATRVCRVARRPRLGRLHPGPALRQRSRRLLPGPAGPLQQRPPAATQRRATERSALLEHGHLSSRGAARMLARARTPAEVGRTWIVASRFGRAIAFA